MNNPTSSLALQHDKNAPLNVGVSPANGGWALSDRWAWSHGLPVSGIARAVAGSIARHANDKTGLSWPGMGLIVKETGFKRTAVIEAIKELERGGHVAVRRFKVGKKNVSNRYQLPPMGNVSASHPSPPDGLGGSPPDGPESVSKESVSTKAARSRCQDCGYSWPSEYGPDCYQCLKVKRDAPRRLRGLPTYTKRPARPATPPMTSEQKAECEGRLLSEGWKLRGGEWQRY